MRTEKKKSAYILYKAEKWIVMAAVMFLALQLGGVRVKAAAPYEANGRLSIKNGKVVNAKGKPFVIKGVSTHGIAWFPEYVNKAAFKTLRDKWGVNTIRLAMYTAEYNGYCTGGDQKQLKKLVENGVKYAGELGMYVIIDWHILSDGNPLTYKSQAVSFFRYAARKYKDAGNVLFEICNEPNGNGGSWKNVKSYAESIIKTIRSVDKKDIIIVGTPTWSQDVDVAMADPVAGYDNIAYGFHFYAATHREALQQKLESVLKKKFPVIVTEFGVSEASGSGSIDTAEGTRWMKLLNKYGVGRVCWSLSNKAESCSLLKSSCFRKNGWTSSDLSTAGKWLVKTYTGKAAADMDPQATVTPKPEVPSAPRPEVTPTPRPAATPAPSRVNQGVSSGKVKLRAVVTKVNSWNNGKNVCTQYKVTIRNTGSQTSRNWRAAVYFGKKFTLSSLWCGVFVKNPKKLVIKPETWNKVLKKGESTEIGFIIETAGNPVIRKTAVAAS